MMSGTQPKPIAIVGMSCRFPADARNPSTLWEMLVQGKDAWSEVPQRRFNLKAFYHPDGSRNGSTNVRGAHFIDEDVALFDAPFFGMTPSEAAALDPQQRLLLETAYEALENGGIPMSKVAGSDTSVFVGSFCRDWSEVTMRDPDSVPMYQALGGGQSLLSNRLSYFFDLSGPSVSIDTACSASLVALHLACQSIRSGESKQAIVGGSNVILSHELMISMSAMRFLSPDGRSYAFDSRANGYGRGEGAACLILKPLEDAIRDGDSVRAVIRQTGCNQDGRTKGITLPSAEAQATLIEKVYREAGLDPAHTTYIEAHGTGTQVGDPLEASALAKCFCRGYDRPEPLAVGSIKTNIGHLEGASGLAGVMKAVLMLENKLIVPNANFIKANPSIPLDTWSLTVPIETRPWEPSSATGVRRASINSFGYGGTNAHVILEEAEPQHVMSALAVAANTRNLIPDAQSNGSTGSTNGHVASSPAVSAPSAKVNGDSDQYYGVPGIHTTTDGLLNHHDTEARNDQRSADMRGGRKLFCLSAFDKASLGRQIENLAEYLRTQPLEGKLAADLSESLAYTLGCRRTLFRWRTSFSALSLSALIEQLDRPHRVTQSSKPLLLGFCFTGQGAQWYKMGRELIHTSATFRHSLIESAQILQSLGAEWDLMREMERDQETSKVNTSELSQPLCTALQIALVELLSTWNMHPSAVTGHSSGEIAAAYACRALSKRDALVVSFERGLAVSSAAATPFGEKGAMLAVGLSPLDAEKHVSSLSTGRATIACYNSPSSLTISGDERAITELQQRLGADGIFNRRLVVERAYHSFHMEPVSGPYLQSIKLIKPDPDAAIDFYSSVTGSRLDPSRLDAEYWVQNMLKPVRFSESLSAMCHGTGAANRKRLKRQSRAAVDLVIEIGPHSALAGPFKQTIRADESLASMELRYHPTLVRDSDAVESLQKLGGVVFEMGYDIDLAAVNQTNPDSLRHILTGLPPYSWDHSTPYWAEAEESKKYRLRTSPRSDLLGVMVRQCSTIEPTWRNLIRISENPWIRDHQVDGQIVYPAAGFIVMAIEACAQKSASSEIDMTGVDLREILIGNALIVPEAPGEVEVFFSLRPCSDSSRGSSTIWNEFRVFSTPANNSSGASIEHCRGLVLIRQGHRILESVRLNETHNSRKKAIKDVCGSVIDVSELYQRLKTIGLEYGPTFAGVQELRSGPGKALAIVKAADSAAAMPANFEYPHLLHPTTLDSCFHALFPALGGFDDVLKQPAMPTFISAISIRHFPDKAAGKLLNVYAENISRNYRDATTSILVYEPDDACSGPAIVIDGLVTTAIASTTSDHDSNAPLRPLCFSTQWDFDPDLLTPDQIKKHCSPDAPPTDEAEHVRLLEEAAFYYIDRAFSHRSSWESSNMPVHHQQLLKALDIFRQNAFDGNIEYNTRAWTDATEEHRHAVMQQVKSSGDEGALLAQVGENLEAILQQEADPLAVMMEGERLTNYYRNNARMARQYDQMGRFITLKAHKNPFLRILEVGAGTGGASFTILEALGGGKQDNPPRFASYDYTDISTGFFEKAETLARPWQDLVSFKKLDIERDPLEQGFNAGVYDIVIAANVLHATKSITTTLANVRKLMKPGGSLLLTELTRKKGSMVMIFGVLPGWWLGDGSRQTSPLLSEDEWDEALKNTGFSGVDVAIWDTPDSVAHHGSNLICSAVEQIPSNGVHNSASLPLKIISGGPISTAVGGLLAVALEGGFESICLTNLESCDVGKGFYIVLIELDGAVLEEPALPSYEKIRSLFTESDGLIWVSKWTDAEGKVIPNSGLVSGLARTVRTEVGSAIQATVHVEGSTSSDEIARCVIQLSKQTFTADAAPSSAEVEYFVRKGKSMIPRVMSDTHLDSFVATRTIESPVQPQAFHQAGRPLRLEIGTPGLLDTLHYIDDDSHSTPLGLDEVQIDVKASGVNFRDVMMAMGQIDVHRLGGECSGVVSAVGTNVTKVQVGDRVTAFADGSFGNQVRRAVDGVEKIPDSMSFEAGATLPIVYCTAYHSIKVAHLTPGETVLIHAASGGLGQALIMLCQNMGVEIFASVGTLEKREFLRSRFNIADDHILSSRDETFATDLLYMTQKRGADVIFNSVSGNLLRRTFECVASHGRFIELGKRDFAVNSRLEMRSFARNVTFAAVDLVTLLAEKPVYGYQLWHEVMSMIRAGAVQPPGPITSFRMGDMEKALRTMQSGRHIGKLVLVPQEDDIVRALPPPTSRTLLHADATYLLVGGLGGLGRAIAKWMVRHGARSLVFVSPSGDRKPNAKETVRELRAEGVLVAVHAKDIANMDQLQEIIQSSKALPPIRGVIQMAMTMRSSMFKNMSVEDWNDSLAPKVRGTWNLHEAFKGHHLDHFIMLSSAVGILGNASQAAYGGASTFLDSFADYRRGLGLPGTTIDIGLVLGIGYVAEQMDDRARRIIERQGFEGMNEKELLALVEAILTGRDHHLASGNIITGLGQWHESETRPMFATPRFAHFRRMANRSIGGRTSPDTKMASVREALQQANTLDEAIATTCHAIINKMAGLLMLSVTDIDETKTMQDYGIDSLVAVEMRNWISANLGAMISVLEILENVSLKTLAQSIIQKLVASNPSMLGGLGT